MDKKTSGNLTTFTYHYPRLAVIITAQYKDKENAMTAAWHMPVSDKPPVYAVAIAPGRFTYQLIVKSGRFGVNFLPFEKVELLAAAGGCSGKNVDKFVKFNIDKDVSGNNSIPILKDAYAAYECRLLDDNQFGDHRLLVGEIVVTHWLDEAFNPDVVIDLNKVNPILYLGTDLYTSTAKGTPKHLNRKLYSRR